MFRARVWVTWGGGVLDFSKKNHVIFFCDWLWFSDFFSRAKKRVECASEQAPSSVVLVPRQLRSFAVFTAVLWGTLRASLARGSASRVLKTLKETAFSVHWDIPSSWRSEKSVQRAPLLPQKSESFFPSQVLKKGKRARECVHIDCASTTFCCLNCQRTVAKS